MAVLKHVVSVTAPMDKVHQLLTSVGRIPDYTQVRKTGGPSAAQLAVGATWKNRGTTLKMPSWDSTTVKEASPRRIAWHTRSMVLGMIPVGADWSYTLEQTGAVSTVTNTFERVTMFGLPVGPLIKSPVLPMVYLARGSMMASGKKLKKAAEGT
jgi:hypothetical protein